MKNCDFANRKDARIHNIQSGWQQGLDSVTIVPCPNLGWLGTLSDLPAVRVAALHRTYTQYRGVECLDRNCLPQRTHREIGTMANDLQAPPLFTILPSGIFSPLASANRQHYWRLLTQLYRDRFGPDAPMPPSVGFQRREIVADLERYLLTDDPWEADDGDAPDASINARAMAIYDRFRDSGWLRQERVGAREMASMPPIIERLLSELIEFAERGPTFLSAKIQAVELQLRHVLDGNGGGDTLDEAAATARQLLSFVASLGVQVRDVMAELSQAASTAAFARTLFDQYVAKLFVGDYAQLRSTDHPLTRRTAILAMVQDLRAGPRHAQLLDWYKQHLSGGDAERAAERLNRSLRRLAEIDRVDEYLGRLDDDIRQANRRALAYLDYRLRAPDKLDVLLQRACRAVQQADERALRLPVAGGALMHEERLRPPRAAPTSIPRSANQTRPPTPEQIARMRLLQRMKRARLVLPADLRAYVAQHWGDGPTLNADALPVATIPQMRAYQTLLTLATRSARTGQVRQGDPLGQYLPGVRVELLADARTVNGTFDAPSFRLHRTGVPRP